MTERETGLRFDINERLSIPEEVDTIERLDEIELTPRIEMIQRGEHTILTGYLALSGSYANIRDESKSMRFQHQIPVEITMPTERIDKRSDIEIDIEQFDFDVVSKGRLQVTGVLLLRGLQPAVTYPRLAAQEEKPVDDEILFVHEAGQPKEVRIEEAVTKPLQTNDAEQASIGDMRDEHLDDEKVGELQPPDWNADIWKPEPPPIPHEPLPDPQHGGAQHSDDEDSDQDVGSGDKDDFDWLDEELYREQKEKEKSAEISAVKQQEMKIAFIGKHAEDSDRIQEGELSDVLTSNNVKSNALDQEATTEQTNEDEDDSRKESGVAWKKLFLSKEEDTPQFKKVRMCIVQKDETLHSIAERYALNPREIVLYNRLGEEQEIVAGQVLFIPQ